MCPTTMSTSNPGTEGSGLGLAPGPELISKWANEFFSAAPGVSPTAVEPTPAPAPEPAVATPAVALPAEASLGSVPTTFPGPTPSATPPSPTVPTVEGLPRASPFSSEPSFSGVDFSAFAFPATPGITASGSPGNFPVETGAQVPSLPKESPGLVGQEQPVLGVPDGEPGSGTASAPAEGKEKPFDAYSFLPLVLSQETAEGRHPAFDAEWFKRDFPILQTTVNGKPLVWLDNAATTQKPRHVIERLSYFYENENSNVHRAAHTLAARSTDAYEGARDKVRRFLGASSAREIVFVRGATEAINLVAKAWGGQNIKEGDEIVISWLEHHANIVPWQQLAKEKGAKLKVIPVDDQGQLILEEYEKLLGPRTRIVSVAQVSNALGTVVSVEEIVKSAHRHGAKVLIDGAQAVSHKRVDVSALAADFYVFSGHKVFGPTGIGVLYGKEDLLNATQPWQGGGNMIQDVTFEKTLYQAAPARFEAGTGNIADAVGLGAALDYLEKVGLENVERHERELLAHGTQLLKEVRGLRLIGTAPEKAGVLSFVIEGLRNEDIAKALDREGIAVRAGHHCAQPILRRLGVEGTVRASLAFYNTFSDLEALAKILCDLTFS